MSLSTIHHILFIGLSLISTRTLFSQVAPEKTFTEKLEGIRIADKELTKNASTDNSSIGQGGNLSTSVPLLTISSKSLSFPLQLNYSSGITTDQKSGPVGLGWVMPMGSIVRDYGAFEPDYSSTKGEIQMINSFDNSIPNGWLNPSGSFINPSTHNEVLGYSTIDAAGTGMPLSDEYHISIPGRMSNTFWNNGTFGTTHDWTWTEFERWKVGHSTHTFEIDQEYSRINEFNRFDCTNCTSKDYFGTTGSYAAAIGVMPYVINGHAMLPSAVPLSPEKVKYEDFESFTVTDDNGVVYVFGRPLRGQKFVFSDNPYWSTSANISVNQGNTPQGNFWKIDYIAEWLLTEIHSPDYVDLNGSGIADDADAGDWIRFEYTETTQTALTIPLGNGLPFESGGALSSTVPKHREWSSFSQTDQASSLMRERAYLTKIITPLQEVDFTISERMDIDHDFLDKPANKKGNEFYYEDRKCSSSGQTGSVNDFDIKYPVETMKYDSIKVYSRLIDKQNYPSENTLTGAIVLKYADKGSPQELAVSDYTLRNNDNTAKLNPNGTHLGTPTSQSPQTADFSIDKCKLGDKRGKTTLLAVEFLGGDLNDSEKTSFEFEYAYNPSYNEIHKREIIRMWTRPNLRKSGYAPAEENVKATVLFDYNELTLNADGVTYSSSTHIGIHPNDFLIDCPYSENYYTYSGLTSTEISEYVQFGIPTYGQVNSSTIDPALSPIVDHYGFLYAENCSECPKAWSLTKIKYPMGGEISFEYEKATYDQSSDENNWAFDQTEVPLIEDYNDLAKERSLLQDVYNDYAVNIGGYSINDPKKTLTATFEMTPSDYYGIRLKKKVTNDRVNLNVETIYEYGDAHFSSLPSGFLATYISSFNQFLIRESERHRTEQSFYPNNMVNAIPNWKNDYTEKMTYAAISNVNIDDYHSTFFYEFIDQKKSDLSFIRYHYSSVSGNLSAIYPNYEVYCTKFPASGRNGRFILGGDPWLAEPITMTKMEFFDATESIPYKIESYEYYYQVIDSRELTFDYGNPSNTLELWNNQFELWLPIHGLGFYNPLYYANNRAIILGPFTNPAIPPNTQWITVGGVMNEFSYAYDADELIQASASITAYPGTYRKWATTKTVLNTKTINYKGLITTTQYEYHPLNFQLRKESLIDSYTQDVVIKEYEYGNETYPIGNLFVAKNILNAPTRSTTYLNVANPNNVLSASMITYDVTSFSDPRVKNQYTYETEVLNSNGTFLLQNSFNINSSSNPNWRISQNNSIEYNKPGQLISSRLNRMYSKTVFGNNLNVPKAIISHPYEAFDATYSGFEDFYGKHSILYWDNDDYKDEKWFIEGELSLDEPAVSWRVAQNPCNNSIPTGENQPYIKELNHVLINNVTGLQVGDNVEIELIGSSHAIPLGYVFEVETTVSGIIQLSSPIQGMQYALCTSDPIIFPEDDGTHPVIGLPSGSFTGIIIEVNEDAGWTISETKVTKLKDDYNLSKTYARTGKYSYKLPTQRVENEPWKKTPVRPVKLKSTPPSSDCLEFPSETEESDDCNFVYEASVWLKYDSDIASIAQGGGGSLKSADIQGDVKYLRGTVSETDNLEGVKIICDVYNSDRTLFTRKIFYVEDIDEDWKQYTVDLDILRGNKWLDVYVQNERSQVGSSIPSYKSVFADDIVIYPKGAKYSYTTYDKFGNETFVTNNNDVFTQNVYDQKGRSILQKNAYGKMVSEQEYFEHPNWSNQVNHVTERKWVSNGIYNESRYYLDGFGKTKQAMVADHARNARVVTESNYFNDKGFVTATFKPYALIGSNLGDNYDTDFIFNAQDLYSSNHALTEVTYEAKPEMKISTMSPPRENIETPIIASQQDYVTTSSFAAPYGTTVLTQNYPAGSLLVHELTDANGNVTKTYMDNIGRVIMEEHSIGEDHIQNADGSITLTTGNSSAKTWFVYDPAGRLVKVVDPSGFQSTYEYNSLGVIVKKTTPDKGILELRYDKFGQVRFVRDQKDIDATNTNAFNTDQFSYWKYDEWGRVLETGQKQAAPVQPSFAGQLLFDDYSKINDQNFPLSTNPLVELHQDFDYDGTRDQFKSDATLCERVYHDHAVNGNLTISAQTTDQKCYDYMADGQVATVKYNYQGLAEHVISYTYNDLRIPIGKRYTHPTESGYDFEWRTSIDNFARTKSNRSIWNGVATQTGQYYYDVLGNLLAKGLGATGNATNPHLDIHFFKFDIRDQLTHHTSKNFRFGLKHDPNGNITDQFWSNELFDPTSGTSSNINQYHYYYDEMNRLIGADYRLGTSTGNPFANFDQLFGNIPNDFLCGVNNLAVDEYLEPVFAEFQSNIENGIEESQSTEAINGLNVLKVEYTQLNIAYSQMTEADKDVLFVNYIRKIDGARIDAKAYELYRAKQEEDWDHFDRVTESDMTKSNMKYTQLLLSGLPFNAATQCEANANATVYGFLPTFPYPTTIMSSEKYDAAYWYTENGNFTDLNRNDENGVKTELDYSYNTANNQIEDVVWSQPNLPIPPTAETHTMEYDANGNILNESMVGTPQISAGSPQGSFTYDDYDELPTSISTASGTRNYRYDSNGQRIVKEVDANEKNYYLDGVIINQNNEVVSYQTPEGYVSVSNNGAIIADYFYNVTDWLGTNRVVIDADGNVVNASDHYPFGKRMPARHMVTDAEGNRYQFTGHEFDEETGFDYHGARYYNRELGRYMNVDPWQEKYFGWSSYNYTMGNPINLIDPTGEGPTSTHIDKDGNVITVINDGDLGVYKHPNNEDGGTPTEYMIKKRQEKWGTAAHGEKIGTTEYWDEFINPETGVAEGVIHEGTSFDGLIQRLFKVSMKYNLYQIAQASKPGQALDIKSNKKLAVDGPMTGRLLKGKYATIRSAGNLLAGQNGRHGTFLGQHVTKTQYMMMAGALDKGVYNWKLAAAIVTGAMTPKQWPWPAPYYGEDEYSGRRILQGWGK